MLKLICTFFILFYFADSSRLYRRNQEQCPLLQDVPPECSPSQKYRSIDGSCNNIAHPEWGKAMVPFLRLLQPDYDNGDNPRTTPTLPEARNISRTIHTDNGEKGKSPVYTIMHMTFGQFLTHDIVYALDHEELTCGEDNCSEEGDCFPIHVPENDTDFTDSKCIEFFRMIADYECKDHREQVNQITSYIDASNVYGSDKDTNDQLRDRSDPSRGKLKITPYPEPKGLLPQHDDPDCFDTDSNIRCFLAGDERVNQQIGLTATHTIFHRAHNTIEEQLHTINPDWSGETLYQETRRIMGAAMQQITYMEYLPLVLGPDAMEKYNLVLMDGDQFWNGYNSTVNPGIANSFSAASFRFAHSQIGNKIRFADAFHNIVVSKFFSGEMFRPASLYIEAISEVGSGLDAVMRGMSSQSAETVDRHLAKQITAHLFTPDPPFGIGKDLAAADIQRGRDHGIQSYLKWRSFCGLSSDLADISEADRNAILSVYKTTDDIDLWVGAIAETHLPQAMVGPTFACLIGEQFKNLRAGDRFWFENEDKDHGFTKDQLKEIRKITLAYLTCANGDSIPEIQPKMMFQPLDDVPTTFRSENAELIQYLYGQDNNARVSCSDIAGPNFDAWKESEKCNRRRNEY